MNNFNEDNLVEKTVISLIEELWHDSNCHTNAFRDSDDFTLGRESRSDVLLHTTLLNSLKKLNPELPEDSINS